MASKVLKSTDRGQITLPKQWRDAFPADHYLADMQDGKIVITPIRFSLSGDEEILFDADRDNEGRGISPDEMIRALKKIRHG